MGTAFPVRSLACALSVLAALAGSTAGRAAAPLTLDVTFSTSNTISVTLPDGTPVGSASGAPTSIPAGYYIVQLSGPMGLPSGLPYFRLSGPGVNLLSNLNEGGLATDTEYVSLKPSSSYTWTDDAVPGTVYTFTTTANVESSAPAAPTSSRAGTPASSQDIVGSDVVSVRGTLTGMVTAAGRVSISLAGKPAVKLPAGRYRISVTDRSGTGGLMLARAGGAPTTVSGIAFVGKRSVTIELTAGRWTVASNLHAHSWTIIVT